MLVESWLARAAATRPQRTALETPAGEWSYERLYAAARLGARELEARGASPGARVAIALPAGGDFVQALHACLLLGATAVPVDPRLSDSERALITAGTTVELKEPLAEGTAAGRTAGGRLADGACERHELSTPALVIHTSGTTGAPRAVELTYGNLLWSALGSSVALGAAANERWLCALPLSHVGGLSIVVRSAIYGTCAVVHERFETDRVLHALRTGAVTLVSLVATTLARLLDAGLREPPSLRCALTGGGPVPAELVERACRAGVPVGLTYGLTEGASQVTTTPAALAVSAAAGGSAEYASGARSGTAAGALSAGPPLFCTRLRIAPDGEILVSGPTVAHAATADDGWLHTGDLGALDEHGQLLVSGRKADTIVSGGENVAPAEVEAALEEHPNVLEAAAVGRADPEWGESVTAIVVARAGMELDVEDLRAHCGRSLAPYKVPKRFILTEQPLPRTSSGKLRRSGLR